MGRLILRSSGGGGGGGGGGFNHGDTVTLNSSSLYGTHALNFSFTGGSQGMIENTAAGVEVSDTFSGYNMSGGGAGEVRGEKKGFDDSTRRRVFESIYSSTFPDAGCFTRDLGTTLFNSAIIYVSMWRYYTNVNAFSSGQIKMTRFNWADDVGDPSTIGYSTLQNGNGGLQYTPAPNNGGTAIISGTGTSLMVQDTWLRTEEILILESTGGSSGTVSGLSDGKFIMRIHNGSSISANLGFVHSGGFTESNIAQLYSSKGVRYILPQGYFGNGNTSGTIRQDDHYFQYGTRKRVELCNNAVYASSTYREIQEPLTWSASQITFRLNIGGFATGQTVYAHVIDDTDASVQSTAVVLN